MTTGSLVSARGIDVSNNNGTINWQQVASSGIDFAIAKVSEGTGFTDRFFPGHWAGMAANGILRGGYHFARPSLNSAQAEADFFIAGIAAAGGLRETDLVVLDLEDPDTTGDLSDWTLQWLERVRVAMGYKPILYSGRYYLQEHGCTTPLIAQYPLWLAAYQATMPANVPPWPTYLIWQYSDGGSIPGISGNVDLDSAGSLADLKAAGKPSATPTPVDPSVVQTGPFAGMTLDQLQAKAEGLLNAVAYLGDTLGDTLIATANEAERVRIEQVGPRPS